MSQNKSADELLSVVPVEAEAIFQKREVLRIFFAFLPFTILESLSQAKRANVGHQGVIFQWFHLNMSRHHITSLLLHTYLVENRK